MPQRIVAYVLLGITAFVIFLFIAAPASLLEGMVARASRNTLAMTNLSGTVWHGSGDLETRPVASPPLHIGRIGWTINPLWLLTGKIDVNMSLTGRGAALTGAARIGFGSLALRNLKATFPAQLMPVFYAPAELLGPGGQVEISTPALEWTLKGGLTGTAEVLWRDAASNFSAVRPLGDYQLRLEGQGTLRLETLKGALQLSGNGNIDSSSGLVRFAGVAVAKERADDLSELLKLMGPGLGTAPRQFHFEFSLRN